MGLRVTSRREDRWWLCVGVRTAVFHVPLVPGVTVGATVPGAVYMANAASNGWISSVPAAAVSSLLLTVLLFATARRGNGWRGVHERLSGTRVVQRHVLRPVASAAPAAPVALVPALSSLRRVGPYAVHATIGDTDGGRLFVGIDPILRRHVWIHEVTPGTPAVSAARRDVSRPGRLYWLAGRRSAAENWDAFEAPRGEPFLSAPPASEWRDVHRALSSLAAELDASVRDDGGADVTLAHIWKRADGQIAVLDFSWPGLDAPEARQTRTAVDLLAAVSARAVAPDAEPSAPLSATRLLRRLTSGAPPALADVDAELRRLASTPSRPSRIRRALPIAMAAVPVVLPILAVSVMLPSLAQRSELMMWMAWLTDAGASRELATPEQRTAAELYVAAHFRAQLTSDAFWNTQVPQIGPFVGMRQRAAEIAARYPAVSADDLARASAIVAPQIQKAAAWRKNFPAGGEALRRFVVRGFAAIQVTFSIVCGLLSALVVPGGLITRTLRHAVVRRDGREIGRVRSAVRLLIAWSPAIAWMAYTGTPVFGGLRAVPPAAAYVAAGGALIAMAAGAVWTIAMPSRGPHDRIAGTWVVSR
jgi:hypothetical protein